MKLHISTVKMLTILTVALFCISTYGQANARNRCGSLRGGEAVNDMNDNTKMKIFGGYKYKEHVFQFSTRGTTTRWLNARDRTNQFNSGVFGSKTDICDVDYYWKPGDNREAAKISVGGKTAHCRGSYPDRTCRVRGGF